MKASKIQTPKQKLASLLRRKEYRGCVGQISYHGTGHVSMQIFAPFEDTRFIGKPLAPASSTDRLVLDINL